MFRFTALQRCALAAVLCAITVVPVSAVGRPPADAARSVPFATVTYGVVDVGAPSSGYTSLSAPLGFNGTGQFVGLAYPAVPPVYQACIAWTGSAWVDLAGSHALDCYATSGISDADAHGVFATVGATFTPTMNQPVAFYAVVSPKTATFTTFSSNAPSELYAMTAGGLAAGFSYYAPFGGFSFYEPAFTSTGKTLDIVQPGCTRVKPGCMQWPLRFSAGGSVQGRSINAGGTILAAAQSTASGEYVEYTTGSHSKIVQFSLPRNAADVRGIDDRGDVVYEAYDPKTAKNLSWTFDPASRTARSLGTLSGSSCTTYSPLWINGPGRVLGYTQGCSFSSDQTYWTWDSTHGMVGVGFDHSHYFSASLTLINDKGQIAANLVTSTGKHHWGYLVPPAKP